MPATFTLDEQDFNELENAIDFFKDLLIIQYHYVDDIDFITCEYKEEIKNARCVHCDGLVFYELRNHCVNVFYSRQGKSYNMFLCESCFDELQKDMTEMELVLISFAKEFIKNDRK